MTLATTNTSAQTSTTLYSFTGANGDGTEPIAGLIADSSGNFYGTTPSGGLSGSRCPNVVFGSGCGIVFELVNRIHDSLSKDTPNGRPTEQRPSSKATVISSARLGGLHHRYSWEEAA